MKKLFKKLLSSDSWSKNFSETVQRVGKNNAGFSLVELIVVIAIMAILAAVAVVGVSVYIPKAQQASDKQMVADIEYVLDLHAQSTPDEVTAGYIILTTGEAQASDGFVTDVLVATYGEDWTSELKLAYDGWEIENVFPSLQEAQYVADSSYYKYNTPSELVDSFSALTDSLSNMAATAAGDPLVTMSKIPGFITDDELASLRGELEAMELSWVEGGDNSAYTTAVSNLLVQKTATEIGNFDGSTPLSEMSQMAANYALLYGWGNTTQEGADFMKDLNEELAKDNTDSAAVVQAMADAMEAAGQSQSFTEYCEEYEESDSNALVSIMGTVSEWSENADMTTTGLYSSDSIMDTVNNYVAAVDVADSLSPEEQQQWTQLVENSEGVVVFVTSAGKVICTMPN